MEFANQNAQAASGAQGGFASQQSVKLAKSEALQAAAARRAEFVSRYEIEVLSPTTVRLVLPKDCSRLEFIREAQDIAAALDLFRKVAQPVQLEMWARDVAFTKPVETKTPIAVNCMVEGTGELTRGEQKEFLAKHGLKMATLQDLATAHVAIMMASEWHDAFRSDLRSHTIRADGGQLFSSLTGLTERAFFMHDFQYHPALMAASYL